MYHMAAINLIGRKLIKKLLKDFPTIPEVKTLSSYILKYPDSKKEEILSYWFKISYNLSLEQPIVRSKITRTIENVYSGITYAEILTKGLLNFAEPLGNNKFLLKFLVNVKNKKFM